MVVTARLLDHFDNLKRLGSVDDDGMRLQCPERLPIISPAHFPSHGLSEGGILAFEIVNVDREAVAPVPWGKLMG